MKAAVLGTHPPGRPAGCQYPAIPRASPVPGEFSSSQPIPTPRAQPGTHRIDTAGQFGLLVPGQLLNPRRRRGLLRTRDDCALRPGEAERAVARHTTFQR
jgi:hypothetical protein